MSTHAQSSSEHGLDGSQRLNAIQSASAQPSTLVSPRSGNTVPELASTIPDSQQPSKAESPNQFQFQFLHPALESNTVVSRVQRMPSQGSDAATQELSPSHFQSILNRSRSGGQLRGHQQDEENETLFSLHEGDEGHIDLISSLPSPGHTVQDPVSDPVEFSPTQTQHALSQFPESQRFKTPATAGKKRGYNGNVMDSPELPRNPLLRGGTEDNDGTMALSQAFAATQADTSPFIQNISGDGQSDRPSPNIQLQPRPVTTTSSSPMRPISTFRRASTEPASRYVPVREEKAHREQQALLNRHQVVDEDSDSNDESYIEPSVIAKMRRQREIEKRKRATFEQLSSPSNPSSRRLSQSRSSPIRGASRHSPQERLPAFHAKSRNGSSPTKYGASIASNESEEETEQEDNVEIAVTRPSQSQALPFLDEEDKENYSENGSQVPETTIRLIRAMSGIPAQVQDSPSLRYRRGTNSIARPISTYSSEPIVVADSQSSQTQRRFRQTVEVIKSTPPPTPPHGLVNFVPQSPIASSQLKEGDLDKNLVKTWNDGQGSEAPAPALPHHGLNASDSQNGQPLQSTIPESSSNKQQFADEKDTIQSKAITHSTDIDSGAGFETAQSRLLPAAKDVDNPSAIDLSSPPIANTPADWRRRRMAEIAAEESPLASQISFNVSQVLHLDEDFQNILGGSPITKRTTSSEYRREKLQLSPSERKVAEHVAQPEPKGRTEHQTAQNSPALITSPAINHGSKPDTVPATPIPIYSRRERKPSSKFLDAAQSRVPGKNPDVFPPPGPIPLSKCTSLLKRKAEDYDGSRKEKEVSLIKRARVGRRKSTPKDSLPLTSVDGDEQVSTSGLLALPASTKLETNENPEPRLYPGPVAPNMVFACFNGKTRAYYPAQCLGVSNTDANRYLIQWEGYEPDEIDKYGVRSLDLRPGDQVKVSLEGFPKISYVVQGFKGKSYQTGAKSNAATLTDIWGFPTLVLVPKQRKSLPMVVSHGELKEVPVSSVYLDSNMWGQMKDRIYEYKPTISAGSVTGHSTPVQRASTPSSPPSRSRRGTAALAPMSTSISGLEPINIGIFTNMVFAISYEDSLRKTKLTDLIQSHGGLVLKESFLDLLEIDSLQLKQQFSDLSFTALLADRHSRKEKYIQALALGVPCLSGKWIDACVESDELADWTTYLLPAGESAELDGATRSRVLPLLKMPPNAKVKDMIASRPTVLNDSRVIVVTGKGKTETKRRPYLFLIRALGAGAIDTEPDLTCAKAALQISRAQAEADEKGTIEWIFVDDRDVASARAMFSPPLSPEKGRKSATSSKQGRSDGEGKGVKVMCNEDIVQSLILGKLWMG